MKKTVSSLLLTLAAFIWGTAFVAQSTALNLIGNFTFLASRSYLGVIALLPVTIAVYRKGKNNEAEKENPVYKTFFSKKLVLVGAICGFLLFVASVFQQIGIISSGVGKSGFLTSLYILIVPLLSVFLKKRVPVSVWISIFIALIGMYFLCVFETSAITSGDFMLILCAFCFGVHIMVVNHFVNSLDGVRLSLMQFFFCALFSTVTALAFEKIDFELMKSAAVSILYAGVLSSGVAYTLQIVAQKNLSPTVASLLMSLESVFAVLAGAVFGERLTSNEISGCVLVFVAIILAQLPAESFLKKNINQN